MRSRLALATLVLALPLLFGTGDASGTVLGQSPPGQEIRPDEYAARRGRIHSALPDGILLLHARSAPKAMEQWGFIQDPSFLYFTGLAELPGAVLALDGPRDESRLFVPPAPVSFGVPLDDLVPLPGAASARRIGVDTVEPWGAMLDWLDQRVADGVTLYVDEPRQPENPGVPPGLDATGGPLGLWRSTLERRYPGARLASAKSAIDALRWVKSAGEISALEKNALATAKALLAVAGRIHPGQSQRRAEVSVVTACVESGAQGPSFWPWIMSGPNSRMEHLPSSFYRYDNLNRTMKAGELVRVDIGCGGSLYGGDVGRTFPVSGTFSEGQREAWNLLVRGYRAGLRAMSAGVSLTAVRQSSVAAVQEAREGLRTSMGREAAETILAQGDAVWHIHGVGIESGEDPLPVLSAGSVLAYEPMVEVQGDAFYLEDMILITENGHEILSRGLPYSAAEIEAAGARGPESPR